MNKLEYLKKYQDPKPSKKNKQDESTIVYKYNTVSKSDDNIDIRMGRLVAENEVDE
jgi:hypothetical protein